MQRLELAVCSCYSIGSVRNIGRPLAVGDPKSANVRTPLGKHSFTNCLKALVTSFRNFWHWRCGKERTIHNRNDLVRHIGIWGVSTSDNGDPLID